MKTTSAFPEPNHTQTPNNFFDMIADMGDAELRVTLIMIRNTFGWHRDGFKMGVAKLADASGLSRQGALDGVAQAEKRGTFRRSNPKSITEAEWELVTLQPVEGEIGKPLQPVEGIPPASRGQVGLNKDKEKKNKSEKDSEKSDEIKSAISAANKEVDAILAQMKLSAGKSWTLLPEIYQPYGKAFCAATGLSYHKKDLFAWIQAFDEWSAEEFPTKDIFDAVKSYADDGKAGWISSPSSITKKMRGLKVSRTVREQAQAKATPEENGEPDWREAWALEQANRENVNA